MLKFLDYTEITPELAGKITATAIRVEANPSLKHLCTQQVHLLAARDAEGYSRSQSRAEPLLEALLKEEAPLFPLVVLSRSLPALEAWYRQEGIGEDILRATLADLKIWTDRHVTLKGLPGLGEWSWLALHFSGRLFRLGRLQFGLAQYQGDVDVRPDADGQPVALLNRPVALTPEGSLRGTNGVETVVASIQPVFADGGITSGAISPVTGLWSGAMACCSLGQAPWVQAGDTVVEVHIPEGEPLDIPACEASLAMARAFFPRYLPEGARVVFHSDSWLLDPHLTGFLPETSNAVRFMKMFPVKYPVVVSEPMMLRRVFGMDYEGPLETAPEQTGMQQALKTWLRDGGKIYTTGGFIF